MPIEVSVGPPVLTINQGGTFVVTDLSGEIAAGSEQGVFADDTRFVSFYALFANGKPWTRLTGSVISHFAARVFLINRAFPTEDATVPAGVLALTLGRAVGGGIHECLDVKNHSMVDVRFNLEIAMRSDFADLFEVKSHHFVRRGRIESEWDQAAGELRTSYTNRDFRRALICRYQHTSSPPRYANGRITFDVALPAGGSWHTCCEYLLVHDGRVRSPAYNSTSCTANGSVAPRPSFRPTKTFIHFIGNR